MRGSGGLPNRSKRPNFSGLDGLSNCCVSCGITELVLWQRHFVVVEESSVSALNFKPAATARPTSTRCSAF